MEWGNLVEWDYAWNQKVNFLTDYTRKFVKPELPHLETTPVFNTERFIRVV
jgi:hypothetical protein